MLREAFQRRRTVVAARIIPTWQAGVPLLPEQDLSDLIDKNFRKLALVYRCVRTKAETVSEPKLVLKVRGEPVERHPVLGLLNHPNDEQSQQEWLEMLVTRLETGGRAPVHKIRAQVGRVTELWTLRPDLFRVVPGADGLIERYELRVPGTGRSERLDVDDVIDIKGSPDPLDDYNPLSPLEVLGRLGVLQRNAIAFLQAFFENNATPAGILKIKTKTSPQQRQEAQEKWREAHTGKSGWQSVSVLDVDAEFQTIGLNLKDLDLGSIWGVTEVAICEAFGVPPILVGAKIGLDRSTFANYAEARISLWEDTLKPQYRRIADKLTHGLRPEFGDDLEIEFDLSSISALQEDETKLWERARGGWNDGLLMMDEARELVGYESLPEEAGQVFKPQQQQGPPALFSENGSKGGGRLASGAVPQIEGTALHVDEIWAARDSRAVRFERPVVLAARRIFRRQQDAVLNALPTGLDPAREVVTEEQQQALAGALASAVADLIREQARQSEDEARRARTRRAPPEERHQDETEEERRVNALREAWLHRVAARVKGINEATAKAIRETLDQGVRESESLEQLGARIRSVFRDASERRALNIARTETMSAANFTAVETYRQNGITFKRWVSARDLRVRDAHKEGEQGGVPQPVVPIGQPFIVGLGRVPMDHPLDPSAPPALVVNCRCVALPVVMEATAAEPPDDRLRRIVFTRAEDGRLLSAEEQLVGEGT